MAGRLDLSRPVPRRHPLPENLTDVQWWADAEHRFEVYWREFTGSPDSLSTGAQWFYMSGEFGAAVLMYQKAIDLLHTLYCCNDLPFVRDMAGVRQPSAADLSITDGYRNSLGATLSLHPNAPVKDSITEVAHRLRDIFSTCKRSGISAGLYGRALLELEPTARRYDVPIDRSDFAESGSTVINNHGIVASGASVVSGNVLASGQGAYAAVAAAPRASSEEITALLRQFIGELSRSGHAERAELTATAEEACQVLAEPSPRLARLKILTSGMAAAVKGTSLLAALAFQIERAIRGL